MVCLFLLWIFYIGTVTSEFDVYKKNEIEHYKAELPPALYNILHDMNLKIDHLQGRDLELTKTVEVLKDDMKIIKLQNNYLTSQLNQMESTCTQIATNMNIIKEHIPDFNTSLNSLQTKVNDFWEITKESSEIPIDIHGTKSDINASDTIYKRILLSDPQSLEMKLQDLTGKVDNLITKHNTDVDLLQQIIHRSLQENIYTRWGRTTCPNINGTEIVYSGYAAGSEYTAEGGGANYLCLPDNPTYQSTGGSYNNIFGVEYQGNFGGLPVSDHDAPCVVCMAKRTAIMMIPGRDTCYQEWTTEYAGFLVSNSADYKGKSEFVCLDALPESRPGGNANDNGALFYHVHTTCGSLPCTPYKEGGTLTCVVCSK